ncbi:MULTISPECIES: hypothetical protein [Corynebacterium]|uniref:hypothetical protein n=1 Tax=Corynebacterium TaxID=1716 RepID=UPI001F10ACE8|nr:MULTISPECIES: hypothetical protein [Corynebacterium]
MSTINKSTLGTFIIAVAVLWQGVGTAVVGHRVEAELSTFTTFAAFFIAAIISSAGFAMRKSGKSSALGLLKSARGIKIALALNLFTAGAFCLFYVSATLIPPTAASVIETSIGPLVVAVFVAFAARRLNKSLIPPLVIVVLALGYFFLGDVDASSGTVAGFVLSIAAGMSAVGVLYSSQWASQLGLDVISIAAIRFHLAWILSGVVAFSTIDMTSFSQGEITSTVVLSMLCITFPILLLQWGIILAPPFVAALIIAALPAVVMVTEILLGASVNPIQLVLLVLIVLITIGQAIKR